ncbi:chaperone modulator CbpM [Cypionkella sinensis]|uniref:Chaperone modulator CbpM n=1 Tax=Cypionkella sinensis TaxID=1756043 RepID=A0ABV7J322_9RHOB
MISIEILIAQNSGLDRQDLERWILNDWVKPERQSGGFVFQEIDVARVKLIRELRQDLDIDEEALPVILSLVDQLYELRRRFQALGDAIAETAPDEFQRKLGAHLVMRARGGLH